MYHSRNHFRLRKYVYSLYFSLLFELVVFKFVQIAYSCSFWYSCAMPHRKHEDNDTDYDADVAGWQLVPLRSQACCSPIKRITCTCACVGIADNNVCTSAAAATHGVTQRAQHMLQSRAPIRHTHARVNALCSRRLRATATSWLEFARVLIWWHQFGESASRQTSCRLGMVDFCVDIDNNHLSMGPLHY